MRPDSTHDNEIGWGWAGSSVLRIMTLTKLIHLDLSVKLTPAESYHGQSSIHPPLQMSKGINNAGVNGAV